MTDTNLIYPYEFQGGRKAVASEVNANFEAVKTCTNGITASLDDIRTAIADLKNKPTREMFDIFYSFSSVAPEGAYPLWTGETINHCKSLYPQFWNKVKNLAVSGSLITVTSEEYEEKLETYGQCGAFYMDELNGHLRLPKITAFISSISELAELAKEEKAGLPNITGGLRPYRMGDPSGAFYDSENGDFYHTNSKDGSSSGAQRTQLFDASKSNEIYGASKTVQPPAVKLCLYLQVANNLGELSALDTNAVASQLSDALTQMETAYNTYNADLQKTYDKIKQDIISSSSAIKILNTDVTESMFVVDSTYEDYPYCLQIEVDEADAALIPTVNFDLPQAASGNYAPIAEAVDGMIKIYAKEIDSQAFIIPSIVLQ